MSTTKRKVTFAEPGKKISRTECSNLADVFRQIGHDERVHKEESPGQMKGAGSSRTASGFP